ncbi:MAG: type II toxin-antitoxin system Phd/YefM family antitoxin [Lachnospiraceae bacterium]|nr:type II toxin-antitoxin system Phd/YefM family antitoxin [Lachnospiraceae bacterium]
MTQVSISELKANPGRFILIAQTEDVLITKNGKVAAKLVSAKADKVAAAKALFGILPSDINIEKAREERLG